MPARRFPQPWPAEGYARGRGGLGSFEKKPLRLACQLAASSRKMSSRRKFYFRLESGSEGIANVVVDRQQLLASEGHRSRNCRSY